MENKKEEQLIEEAKKTSIKEASAYSFMDGFGLRYITPYALSLNANNTIIGLLNSVPNLAGNFSQLFTLSSMEKYSRKKIVFLGVLLQALMWLPLLLVGILFFNKPFTPIMLLLTYTILVLCGSFPGPAWASWMKDLVTKKFGEYFGKRNKIAGFLALSGMLVAALILDFFKAKNALIIGFAVLFIIAMFGRFISAYLLKKQYEPEIKFEKGYYFSFLQFLKAMPSNNFGRFTLYVSIVSSVTAIASPFFAVYMLKDLNFNYTFFTIVVLSNSLSSILFMSPWGKFADTHGNLKVIKIAGFMIIFVPFLWFFSSFLFPSSIVLYLIIIEAFSGFAWAGFNLSAGNFIYDAVTRQRMALCVSYFNVINSLGAFLGTLIGGVIASSSLSLFGISPILLVFMLSGFLMLPIFFLFLSKIKEVRDVKEFGIRHAKEKILSFPKNIKDNIISLSSRLPLIEQSAK